ncbi:MAG TPA: NAD(P)H-dependent oxidoreductase [Myxococcota bacterium]|nr:NAD(P)H-dependent oxidoreductase [Myxococcota bacterium]
MKLAAIVGSLRQGSLNRQLLELALRCLAASGVEFDRIELRALTIPFYDGDVEAASGLPPGAQELGRRIAAADGLVIASPEYNMSLPALLKNAIDWLSRARPVPLRGKTALLLSASPSLVGGNRGLWALRVPLEVLGVHVYPDMFSLASAHQAFRDDGELGDEALGKFLRRVIEGFVRVTGAHTSQEKKS